MPFPKREKNTQKNTKLFKEKHKFSRISVIDMNFFKKMFTKNYTLIVTNLHVPGFKAAGGYDDLPCSNLTAPLVGLRFISSNLSLNRSNSFVLPVSGSTTEF